uniref:Receptor for retinol uptake STRA6 n=1 Tax=Magallana gigas TaxID=29159 RepID=K1QPP7_MAGGI
MVFLCVSFPARLVRSVRKLMARVVGSFVEFSAQEIDRIKETPQGRYVQGLLRKKLSSRNQSKSEPDNVFQEFLKEYLQKVKAQLTYKKIPDFRYSLRMMCVVVVGILLIYMISAEVLLVLVPLLSNILSQIWKTIALIDEIKEAESIGTNFTVTVLFVTWDVATAIQVCSILSVSLGFCIGLMNIIHTLTSYRPMIVFSFLVRILQILTARFVFLQNRGRVMAIQNKQGYHLFLYFTFILDIIIGSMRCPYRLLKAVTLGALTLARLDHSSLSREFETLDTGFRAYVGFLHFENVTSHPVLLTFVRLLLARPSGFEPKWRKMKLSLKASVAQGEVHIAELGNAFWKDNQMSKKALARHRWHLVYTLMKNPQLQFLRRTTNDWLED